MQGHGRGPPPGSPPGLGLRTVHSRPEKHSSRDAATGWERGMALLPVGNRTGFAPKHQSPWFSGGSVGAAALLSCARNHPPPGAARDPYPPRCQGGTLREMSRGPQWSPTESQPRGGTNLGGIPQLSPAPRPGHQHFLHRKASLVPSRRERPEDQRPLRTVGVGCEAS